MNNKTGQEEQMVSCAECGRSGKLLSSPRCDSRFTLALAHPTCLQLPEIGHIMLSYDWHCADCKKCEICKQKGRAVSTAVISVQV